ncbi:prepilin peptidase dependent protein C, partial [Klebsiella pneumoniae]
HECVVYEIMSNSSVLLALSLFVQDASLKYATENNLSEAQNYMQLWRQNGEKMDIKASLKIYLMMELFLKRIVLMANTSTIFRFS